MNLSRLLQNKHLLSLAGNLLPAIMGLLSFMILVRGLDKDTFGNWILYLTAFTFLEMVKSGGLSSALVIQLSGKEPEVQNKLVGSAWKISVLVSVISGLLIWALYPFAKASWGGGILVFISWYPVIGFITLPFNLTQPVLQAQNRFDRLLILRFVNSFGLLLMSGLVYFFSFSLVELVWLHGALQAITAIIVLGSGWAMVKTLFSSNFYGGSDLFRLGKYSFGTLAATNLLKSADTFLIGLFMGPAAVAAYSVPLRLTELIEIPLRSTTATAFPKFSALYNQNNPTELKKQFYQYSGLVTLLFFPAIVGAFVFAGPIIILFGGKSYLAMAGVFRVFLLYGLLAPLDRFTGVLLDAMHKPSLNLYKVMIMAAVNILGDIAALYFFKDLQAVAFASVLNALVGIVLGYYLVSRSISVSPLQSLNTGITQVKWLYKNYRQTSKGKVV